MPLPECELAVAAARVDSPSSTVCGREADGLAVACEFEAVLELMPRITHQLLDSAGLLLEGLWSSGPKTCPAAVSPDGSLYASGDTDGKVTLWDTVDGKLLYTFDAGSTINALALHHVRYWLTAATDTAIIIWDLESKTVVDQTVPTTPPHHIIWGDGNTLFAGSVGHSYAYEMIEV